MHQLQLVSPSPLCSIVVLVQIFTSLFAYFLPCGLFLLLLLTITRSGCLVEIRWSACISKSQRSVCHILQYRFWVVHIRPLRMFKLRFFVQFPVDFFPYRIGPCLKLFFVLIYCISLWYDWSLRLYHQITYTCYFSFPLLWASCWSFPARLFQEWSRVFYEGNSPGIYPFDEISTQ